MRVVQSSSVPDGLFLIDRTFDVTEGEKQIYLVPETTFNQVEKFVCLFPALKDLLKADGNPYWENDVHGKIVRLLVLLMPDHKERDISTALSACGF